MYIWQGVLLGVGQIAPLPDERGIKHCELRSLVVVPGQRQVQARRMWERVSLFRAKILQYDSCYGMRVDVHNWRCVLQGQGLGFGTCAATAGAGAGALQSVLDHDIAKAALLHQAWL